MNPLFGRRTLAKHSAGRVYYHAEKENITNDSINDVTIRDFTPIKSPAARPVVPPLTPANNADQRQPFSFTATPSLSTLRTSSPGTRGSVIYRTAGGRGTLTPRRRGSKIVTTNPLPHLLESVNHRERVPSSSSSSSSSSSGDGKNEISSPPLFVGGSRIQGPTTPQVKLTKKEQRKHRKSIKIMKKELEHGCRSTISQPYNFVHRLHVEEDLTWKDLSGNEALSNLQLVEKLGEGSYGEVYKARAVTGAILVVKVINIQLDNEESFRREIDILRECSHTNIVPYYGTIYEQDSVWILMEYCALGSLRDLIDICRPLTESEVAVVCFHTLKALIYLHSRNIIHRDVKAANILLNDQAQVKIADFGVSEQFSGHGAESRTSDKVLGTPLWMAPEVATACALSSSAGKYDFKAWSSELNDFISQCLIKDPNERPRAVDLFMHPFIEQVYSANSEVVLKSLIREFKEAKEAHTKLEAEEEREAIADQAKRNSSNSSSLSSSTSGGSSAHGGSHSMDRAAMSTGEFVDLASSDTIIVRQDGEIEEDEKEADHGAWGTMVVNAEEEATGQFRKMFAEQKTEATAAAASAETVRQADEETEAEKRTRQGKSTKKKREKRKRTHSSSINNGYPASSSTAGKKKHKSGEEARVRPDQETVGGDDDGEEEWEKGQLR